MKSRTPLVPLALLVATAATLFSQALPPPPPAPAEVVELSPFTVNTSRDLGYQAENTLAGSRLNAPLRDTAASVTVFTREFLDDLGVTDLRDLLPYTVNAALNNGESGSGGGENNVFNAISLTQSIVNRGITTSLGMDYFTSITPTDPYRVGRYEDNRGPNSILFGIGAPGGLINESSKTASLLRDSATLRYGFGSFDRHRFELDANKILLRDRLAFSVAGLLQQNGGWRAWDFQDKKRVFASVTARPARTLSITAMGEIGRDIHASIRNTVDTDEMLAWLDNRNARGVAAVTFRPDNALPTVAMSALGVTGRDGTRGGNNRKAIFVENSGTTFDGIGTFLTGTYNNAAVRAPDGTPGVTASGLRLRGAGLIPDNLNASGSGQNRDAALRNLTLTADWQPLPNLAINLAHNFQYSRAMVRLLGGAEPALRGDANATQGIGGPANPFAGRLYFDGNWQRHFHIGQVRETRLSASYLLEPRPTWLGRHRLAAMVSQADQFDWVSLGFLVLKGRPFNAVAANAPNRLTVRHYITEGSWATYRAGDWRAVPAAINFDGRTFATEWANSTNNSNNSGADQESRSALGVVQSRFFGDRLVTTVGYRQDKVDVFELGYYNEPDIGQIVDRDRSKARLTSATGFTGNIGAVWHVRDWVSVIANRSNNRGVPSFTRRTFPDATLAPPSEGEGMDVGLGFDLLGGRVSARVTYFESSETNLVTQNGVAGAPARNARVADAFEGALVGAGRPYTAAQWQPIEAALAPPVTGATSDAEASGYEARLTANLTRNWRLVLNYSYSDFIRTNVGAEVIEWYGLKDASGRLQQGVRQDTAGRFVADPAAFEAGKTVAKWLELGAQAPQANVSTLTTSTGQTVAQEIFALVDTMNAERDNEQKRWGLRPHKVSVFTAYDFKEGALTGFTAGGGWRWRSANVIGANSRGGELFGRALVSTDLMLAYTRKFARLPGRVRFQLNVYNVLDKTEFIPVRLATGVTAPDGFFVPGGRGLAYSRYDMVAPREMRFTTTYSF